MCVHIHNSTHGIKKFIMIHYQILLHNTCNLCICLWQGLMKFMINPLINYRSTQQEVNNTIILSPDMGPCYLYMGGF